MTDRQFYVYIITNKNNTVLYTGITGDLRKRIYEHRNKLVEGFSMRYNLTKLVYCETYPDPVCAISREKQIKAGSRDKKMKLIAGMNPGMTDLYERI
jgi:putative endonuclease